MHVHFADPRERLMRQQGMTGPEFEKLVLWQLGKYIERSACKAMASDTEEDPVAATILMVLKFMLARASLTTEVSRERVDDGQGGASRELELGPSPLPPPTITNGRDGIKVSTW